MCYCHSGLSGIFLKDSRQAGVTKLRRALNIQESILPATPCKIILKTSENMCYRYEHRALLAPCLIEFLQCDL